MDCIVAPMRKSLVVALSTILALAATLAGQAPEHAVALNPSEAGYVPELAVDGGVVHAVGLQPDTRIAGFVHYARSSDGGRTWPIRELPIGYASRVLAIDADGDVVVVLVHSDWLGPYAISSQDGGASWALPVKISARNVYGTYPDMAVHVDGLTVNVIWLERRAAGRIWSDRSTDGGLTWQPIDTPLDSGVSVSNPIESSQTLVSMASGATVDVMWVHQSLTGSVTLHQRTTDGGATWLPSATIVVPGVMQVGGGDGNSLFVSRGSPLPDVYSGDGGATWATMPSPGFVGLDSVAVDGQNVIVTQDVDLFGVSHELRINVSHDGGTTWLPQPYLISVPSGFASHAFVVGDTFFVQVQFFALAALTGSLIRSDDGGVGWRVVTGEASLGFWPARDRAVVTTSPIGAIQARAYVVAGHTPRGQGTAGTGGRVPRLSGRGLSGTGAVLALELDNALGATVGAIVASFAPASPSAFGSTTVWVQSPAVALPVLTSSGGSATRGVLVPPDPAFAGLTLTSQAFVVDLVAPDGFAASGAIESWIY